MELPTLNFVFSQLFVVNAFFVRVVCFSVGQIVVEDIDRSAKLCM